MWVPCQLEKLGWHGKESARRLFPALGMVMLELLWGRVEWSHQEPTKALALVNTRARKILRRVERTNFLEWFVEWYRTDQLGELALLRPPLKLEVKPSSTTTFLHTRMWRWTREPCCRKASCAYHVDLLETIVQSLRWPLHHSWLPNLINKSDWQKWIHIKKPTCKVVWKV